MVSPFVSDLVGNPEDRFSHNEAHMMYFPPDSEVWGSKVSFFTVKFMIEMMVCRIGLKLTFLTAVEHEIETVVYTFGMSACTWRL